MKFNPWSIFVSISCVFGFWCFAHECLIPLSNGTEWHLSPNSWFTPMLAALFCRMIVLQQEHASIDVAERSLSQANIWSYTLLVGIGTGLLFGIFFLAPMGIFLAGWTYGFLGGIAYGVAFLLPLTIASMIFTIQWSSR